MESNYNWEMITRYVLNESSEDEKKVIESKIKSDNDFAKAVQEMSQIVNVKQKPFQVKDVDLKWEKVKSDLIGVSKAKQHNIYPISNRNKPKRQFRRKTFKVWRYVAAIVFAIGMSYFLSNELGTPQKIVQNEYKTLIVNNGERKTIVLYDGTTIILDAGSELKYPKKFGDVRKVYLKGEGFFQVAKNSKKPFHIFVNNALVEVIGTKFNIKSWEEDAKGVTVSVSEGKVALGLANSDTSEKVILVKNMQSSLSPYGKLSKPIMVDASNTLKWMNNEIHFQDVNLRQVISQLKRWYDLEFEVEDKLLEKKNLTVHLNNTNLNDVLELISTITQTRLERQGKKISFIK